MNTAFCEDETALAALLPQGRMPGFSRPLPSPFAGRSRIARERAQTARAALANCHLCEHHCGVNRLQGEQGLCRAGAQAHVFSAQVEVADEQELVPTFAVALNGCDLRCEFCITAEESWNARGGRLMPLAALAEQAQAALAAGARTVMILGGEPTVHLPSALELVAALPEEARLVWKTNAHGSAQAYHLLAGLIDVWLADFKFGNDRCALELARVPNYIAVLQRNLRWMFGLPAKGRLKNQARECECPREPKYCIEADGATAREDARPPGGNTSATFPAIGGERAEGRQTCPGTRGLGFEGPLGLRSTNESELIVRHLLLPGHAECCWAPIAAWLAGELPGVKVSLRTEFWPARPARGQDALARSLAAKEIEQAREIARQHHLNLIA